MRSRALPSQAQSGSRPTLLMGCSADCPSGSASRSGHGAELFRGARCASHESAPNLLLGKHEGVPVGSGQEIVESTHRGPRLAPSPTRPARGLSKPHGAQSLTCLARPGLFLRPPSSAGSGVRVRDRAVSVSVVASLSPALSTPCPALTAVRSFREIYPRPPPAFMHTRRTPAALHARAGAR